jgi:hypothetical protein
MGAMTQAELADKYRVTRPFVSTALRGIDPVGEKQGDKKILRTYDEKEAAGAIFRDLKDRAEKKRAAWEEAKKEADYAEGVMRANGLIDNPRWRL